jgi:epoxide hydrolase 4
MTGGRLVPLLSALLLVGLAVPAVASESRRYDMQAAAHPIDVVDPAVLLANGMSVAGPRFREGYFGEGETRLHYVEAGEGPLIILYHGFPSFWLSWYKQMEALKGCYRVVAVDALGAGLSAKPERLAPYRVEALAARLDALSRHLGGDTRFTLIGHDWGAALAWSYAQAYPHRVDRLVAMSAPPTNLFLRLVAEDAEQQARSDYMQRFRALTLGDIETRGIPQSLWQASYAAIIADGSLTAAEGEAFRAALADPRAVNGGMNWYRANIPPFAEIDSADVWPSTSATTSVPTLLLWGAEDEVFVDRWLALAPAFASDLRVEILPGVGHWTPIQRSELANAAIARFLDRPGCAVSTQAG